MPLQPVLNLGDAKASYGAYPVTRHATAGGLLVDPVGTHAEFLRKLVSREEIFHGPNCKEVSAHSSGAIPILGTSRGGWQDCARSESRGQ